MNGRKNEIAQQITLPKEVRQKLHIEVGDTLLMDADGEHVFFRKGKTIFDFKGVLPSMGMTIDKIRGITTAYTYDEVDFKRIDGLTVIKP